MLLDQACLQKEQAVSSKCSIKNQCQGTGYAHYSENYLSLFSPWYNFDLSLAHIQVGGRNAVLVDALSRQIPLVTDKPTIIFGADVTHPQPGEDMSPSIAAVRLFGKNEPLVVQHYI